MGWKESLGSVSAIYEDLNSLVRVCQNSCSGIRSSVSCGVWSSSLRLVDWSKRGRVGKGVGVPYQLVVGYPSGITDLLNVADLLGVEGSLVGTSTNSGVLHTPLGDCGFVGCWVLGALRVDVP